MGKQRGSGGVGRGEAPSRATTATVASAPTRAGATVSTMTSADPKVKICGVTRLEDAKLATDLGAWSVGMVFHDQSPRRCSMDEARRISASLRRRTALCGVFVNSSLEELAEVARELDLALVQLHGDEGPSFCAEVARRTGARVIKALQVSAAGDIDDAERFRVDFHLLD